MQVVDILLFVAEKTALGLEMPNVWVVGSGHWHEQVFESVELVLVVQFV
jgi:hypothetical protein